ncbi:toluene tolerance protein [Pseudomonas sp. CCM 7891]|uniref:Toluene tolerance protein n=1 Tax=Pseudomonas karstica TaxID=1055468 RepID=A0A7X2RPK6_9PSED|nr:toluene tolerance protein [Pseudomonas karstica]MTD18638.1 toluene tolerance protein [Pseudomonas karstica]
MQCSRLAQATLTIMTEGARILEADSFGPKVYLLTDGNILKLFRRKRLFSSALFRPYSQRFITNAAGLHERGIPTLNVLDFYQLPTPGMTAVLYQPLPGETLRQISSKEGFDWQDNLAPLVALIRRLHTAGIYFRSLHLGNIVVTPDNEMGLIDVADMRFLHAPLSPALVKRNLQHFARYIARENLNERFPIQALEQALLPT